MLSSLAGFIKNHKEMFIFFFVAGIVYLTLGSVKESTFWGEPAIQATKDRARGSKVRSVFAVSTTPFMP